MNNTQSHKTLECLHPWYSMDVSFAGFSKVGCCPYKGRPYPMPNPDKPDLRALWNGEWFQRLRQGFAVSGHMAKGCVGCRQNKTIDTFIVPHHINQRQRQNLATLLNEARNHRIRSEGLPSRYSFCFTPRCNLKCIMCSQHDSRDHAAQQELSATALLEQEDVLAHASSILVSGGEPFVSGECIRFIQALCEHPHLRNIELEIITNGLLLDRVLPFLKQKEQLKLHISLDGIGSTYERVRRGGNWKRVSSQIEKVLGLRNETGRNWTISSSCILMRSTVDGVPDFIRWCLKRNINVVLQELMATRETDDENLILKPELLQQLPAWRVRLQEAETMLHQAARPELASRISSYRQRLEKSATEKKPLTFSQIEPDVSGCPVLTGKTVVIWGTGTNYQWCWAHWLQQNLPHISFCGFVDSEPERHGIIMDGFRIHAPTDLLTLNPDTLIVAAQIVWRHEIIDAARMMGYKGEII